jgi:tetratricopeptide (TPR) repeat protein
MAALRQKRQRDTEVLRWSFMAVGYGLLFFHDFVINSIVRPGFWAELIFPGNYRIYALAMGVSYMLLIPSGLACLATAWGLKRNYKWSRWTGIAACCFLLAGFPWLTLLGAIGLYVLIAKPLEFASPTHSDPWNDRKRSITQQILIGVAGIATIVGIGAISRQANLMGLPEWTEGASFWIPLILLLELVHVALHEAGHALLTWAQHDRIQEIAVGPLVISPGSPQSRIRFDWRRLFTLGGHVGFLLSDSENARRKQIIVIAAGPAASLLTGLLALTVFVFLPGTHLEACWSVPACYCVIALVGCVLNLIPVGYSDGTMLFHLLFKTSSGEQLIVRQLVALTIEQQQRAWDRADFETHIEPLFAVLERARKAPDPLAAAMCLQSIGLAYSFLQNWIEAQAAFTELRDLESTGAVPAHISFTARDGLHEVSFYRRLAESQLAYAEVLNVYQGLKQRDIKTASKLGITLGYAHLRAGRFDRAFEEALLSLSARRTARSGILLEASALSLQAIAAWNLGRTEQGLAVAREAAALFRSTKVPPARRNLAWHQIGSLGSYFWMYRETELAEQLLRESIGQLESAGAGSATVRYRIDLANLYRREGRLDAAWQTLPESVGISSGWQRQLLREKSELLLAMGRFPEAISASQELLAMWQVIPAAQGIETAVAEDTLARARLAAGDFADTELLAQSATAHA